MKKLVQFILDITGVINEFVYIYLSPKWVINLQRMLNLVKIHLAGKQFVNIIILNHVFSNEQNKKLLITS